MDDTQRELSQNPHYTLAHINRAPLSLQARAQTSLQLMERSTNMEFIFSTGTSVISPACIVKACFKLIAIDGRVNEF